jgi:sortase (surface protein transpeptidase)
MLELLIIGMLINGHYLPVTHNPDVKHVTERAGYADVYRWGDGQMIMAHNYLSGALFYNVDSVTVFYSGGESKEFEVKQQTVAQPQDWTSIIMEYSDDATITLATCYPLGAAGGGSVLLVELAEAMQDER